MTKSTSILGFLAVTALLSGCEQLSEITPKVRFDTLDVKDISFDDVQADFVFRVENPNPIEVGLDRFSYDLELEAVSLLTGDQPEGLNLPALDAAEVRLPAKLVWAEVWDTVQAIRGEDEVDFGLGGSFGFDTQWGPLDLPYVTEGRFPALRAPKFRLGKLRVTGVDVLRGKATASLGLNVDNDHGSTLTFRDMDYRVSLRGREVATGLVPQLGAVEGATEKSVDVPVTVDLLKAGGAILDILTAGGKLEAGIDATTQVDTPFGILPLSIDETGEVTVER